MSNNPTAAYQQIQQSSSNISLRELHEERDRKIVDRIAWEQNLTAVIRGYSGPVFFETDMPI